MVGPVGRARMSSRMYSSGSILCVRCLNHVSAPADVDPRLYASTQSGQFVSGFSSGAPATWSGTVRGPYSSASCFVSMTCTRSLGHG